MSGGAPGSRLWTAALCGVLVFSFGMALAYGTMTPRGFAADEPAHTAYAQYLRVRQLPDVFTRTLDRADSVVTPAQDPEAFVYVANHPPLFAAVQGGIAGVLSRAGLAEGSELAVGRVLNALFSAAALVVVALAGREQMGRWGPGVLAAGLLAAVPALWSLATFGYSDGIALLAVALVCWASIAAWNRRTDRSMWWLGGAVAFAAGTRATALVVAVAAAAVVVLHRTIAASGGLGRLARFGGDVGRTASPAAVAWGWWYVRVWRLTGDPTASAELNGRLGRSPRPGGTLAAMGNTAVWHDIASALLASAYPAFLASPFGLPSWVLWGWALVAVLALAGLLLPARLRSGGLPVPAPAVAVLVVMVLAVAYGIAGHRSGGGTAHPRYFLLGGPPLALLVTCGLSRLHRWAPVAVVALAAAATLWTYRRATVWMEGVMATLGEVRFGSAVLGGAGVVVAVVGLGLFLVAAVRAVVAEGRG